MTLHCRFGQLGEHADSCLHSLRRFLIELIEEGRSGNSQPESGGGLLHGFNIIFLRVLDTGDIMRIVAGHIVEHHRCIFDRLRHGTAVVQRVRQRDDSANRYQAIGRFKPDNAAVGGRHPDRAPGIRSQSSEGHVCDHRGSRSAR